MSIPNMTTMGTSQYTSAVPAQVTEALSEIAHAELMLSNINGVLSVVQGNNALKQAESEAKSIIKEGWGNAIGQFAVGLTQVVAGAMTMKSATDFLSKMSEGSDIDTKLAAKEQEKQGIIERSESNVSAQDEELPQSNDQNEELDKVNKEIDALKEQKGKVESEQRILEGKMKRTMGMDEIVRGSGQVLQAGSQVYAAEQRASQTMERTIGGMMQNQSQQFAQRADQFESEMNKPFEQLVQMAQTQSAR
ncbi:MAG: hypothetical protein KDK64_01935 [Chlamydiia bacterium]|nr:hypothetical protein [Chlamydiia bacterium]